MYIFDEYFNILCRAWGWDNVKNQQDNLVSVGYLLLKYSISVLRRMHVIKTKLRFYDRLPHNSESTTEVVKTQSVKSCPSFNWKGGGVDNLD